MVEGGAAGAIPKPLVRTGRGEPLLLLHGVLLTWQSWIPVIDDLATDHEILAPTLPGHYGGPEPARPVTVAALADFAEALLDEAGWPTAHIVGNSLGGWLALELAARGRARSVTAIAPAGLWRTPQAADALLRKFLVFGPVVGISTDQPPAMPTMLRSLLLPLLAHRPAAVPNQLAKAMAAAVTRCTITTDLTRDPLLPNGFTALEALTTPVTILLPQHDRILPAHLYPTLPTTPTLDVRPLTGVGHVPMLEAPTRIIAEVRATLTRAAGRQSA
ncbi:alpha/beta fold hydrolase [Nocardia sp. NPDC005978]|uniref:alpha/beta fold hydrolase n=1 Tax=Nocardia sp. NPDC005978 TaxID=3156725 RepID=UPI0033B1D6F3